LVIGLFLYRYLNEYIGTKAENRAAIEDSPALIAIQKRLDEVSSISADIGKEKLGAYLTVGSQFAALIDEFEKIHIWATRIVSDEELARLSRSFSADGAAGRIGVILTNIEQIRLSRDWLLHWKVAAILYAVRVKGQEVLAALNIFKSETEEWQTKRAHMLAVDSLATVFREFQKLCSLASRDDLRSGNYGIQGEPDDDEFASFAKDLGDVGRAESRRFEGSYPAEWAAIRHENVETQERDRIAFKRKLAEDLGEELSLNEDYTGDGGDVA